MQQFLPMFRRRAAFAALLLCEAPVVAAAPRIVSINPCLDAIVLEVADPGQIAAISHYSRQPRATSIPLAMAARFAVTSGSAEEVVALSPDLVIAGSHVDPATVKALRRLGIRLLQLGVPASIAESQAQIRTIAAAAGQPARGARLNARIDAALVAARPAQAWRVPALIWQGGGLVPGHGTLPGALLEAAGFHNMSADHGLDSWDVLPLEPLVARPPRVLFSPGLSGDADRILGHPVLRPLARQTRISPFPERLMRCGGPGLVEALAYLKAVRQTL